MMTYRTAHRVIVRPLLATAILLAVPLVAMHFTHEVVWTPVDFIFAGALILGAGIPFELALRKSRNMGYRAGVGLALASAFLMLWADGAVGITDSAADAFYLVAVVIGVIGAFAARFRPAGMARAMFATALAQALVGVVALSVGVVPAYNSAIEILGITAFFAALFVGSALLFRQAAHT
jgi:hypothetical protein